MEKNNNKPKGKEDLISVIIRAHNSEAFIAQAITSALHQTINNYEVIIINDGSTDKTRLVVESFQDQKIKLINQPHSGAFQAAYAGLAQAQGDKIIFLDSDDEITETALEELSAALVSEKYGFSYCDYDEINIETGGKKRVSLKNIFNSFACGIMFKRAVLDHIGFWDKSFLLPEYDFLIRVMKKYKGYHLQKPLYIYKRHRQSMTADKSFVQKAEEQIFAKYGKIKGLKKY